MAQSLACMTTHIVFSTQGRMPCLAVEYRPALYSYLAGIARGESSHVYEIGGIDDHVHLLCSLPRTKTLATLVQLLKKSSSKWLKTQSPALRAFAWQNGYGAFAVSASQITRVRDYIRNQELHHRHTTFKNEFVVLLRGSSLTFDEERIWD